jgi:uncharacterized ion transporter superfamily protein YfcC
MKLNQLKLPHPLYMLVGIMIIAMIATYLIPAGVYDRSEINGKMAVVHGTFHYIEQTPLSIGQFFMAFQNGYKGAIDIIFIIIASGLMFGMISATGTLENVIASVVKKTGTKNPALVIVIATLFYGVLGIFIGYENNIATVPIACILSLALGGDLILAAGIAVGGMTVGFGMSPVNAYTVGTAHNIGGLPLFSGAGLRSVACIIGLAVMCWYNVRYYRRIIRNPSSSLGIDLNKEGFELDIHKQHPISNYDRLIIGLFIALLLVSLFGVFKYHWFLPELSALYVAFALMMSFIVKKSTDELGEIFLKSVAGVAPGAFIVGLAASIRVILEQGNVNDTIAHFLAENLTGLPLQLSAIGVMFTESLINFFIPSGSGQALATLPILFPVGDLIGLTRQTVTLAFQLGDGLSNLINPVQGGIIAMTAACHVPIDRWIKFIFGVFWRLYLIGIIFVLISVIINYK